MSKVRIKSNSFGFTKIIEENGILKTCLKSGIGTKSNFKFNVDDYLSFSFFENDILHSNLGNISNSLFYNDNKTIEFIQKDVINTLNLEEKYLNDVNFKDQQKILSTPNTFFGLSGDSTNYVKSSLNTDSKWYDRTLKENYIKSKKSNYAETGEHVYYPDLNNNPYGENLKNSRDIITFDYDLRSTLSQEVSLSMSRANNSFNISFTDGTSFEGFNGNTAYFYSPNKIKENDRCYDYLGNVTNNYFSSADGMIDNAPICFNNISQTYLNYAKDYVSNIIPELISLQNYSVGGIPIHNFGFPFDGRYTPKNTHSIKMSNYITKPFLIEKVKLDFSMSNWSQSISDSVPCLNFVSFFLLNQRKKINTTNLKATITSNHSNSPSDPTSQYEYAVNYGGNVTYTKPSQNSTTFTDYEIDWMENFGENSGYIETNSISFPAQRDLITSATIANYSSRSDQQLVNVNKIKEIVDEFVDMSSTDNIGSTQECFYQNRKFSIVSNVKNFFKNEKLPKFTSYNIEASNPDSTRTSIGISSRKSLPLEEYSNTGTVNTWSSTFNYDVKTLEKNFLESEYLITPEDELILGVTLTPSADLNDTDYANTQNPYGRDLVKILSQENFPVKVQLIGRYLENNAKKTIKNKEIKNYKNLKKIGYIQNEIVDQIGSNTARLDQNFYDRSVIGLARYYRNLYLNSGENRTGLGNFFELPSFASKTFTFDNINDQDNPEIAIAQNPESEYSKTLTSDYFTYTVDNEVKYYPAKQYFNKYRFGHFSDRLNYNRRYQYVNSNIFNIDKKFMSGYYKQKTPANVSASITLDFSGIHEFKGKNFLTEMLFIDEDTWNWTSEDDGPQVATITLVKFSITDYSGKKINYVLQIPEDNSDKDLYNNSNSPLPSGLGLYYKDQYKINNDPNGDYVNSEWDGEIYFYHTFLRTLPDNFINGNYNTTLPAIYTGRVKYWIDYLVTSIANAINLSNLSLQNKETLNFQVEAAYDDLNSQSEKYVIKVTGKAKGKLKNYNLSFNKTGPNITYENFKIEEGEEINSYNIHKNAYYNDSELYFTDNSSNI